MPNPLEVAEAALVYRTWGWSVIPVGADKRPALAEWKPYQSRGATDQEMDGWWGLSSWDPAPGVGIVCGVVSRLVVLDVDPRNGGADSLNALVISGRDIPETVTAQTGGGGTHYYFRLTQPLRSAPAIAPGLDLKAEGSYVVAPPSPHPSGGRYTWLIPPDEAVIAHIPAWLIAIATKQRARAATSFPERTLGEHERNNGLTIIAGSLRRKGVPAVALEAALQAINASMCIPPLDAQEVSTIAASVGRYAPAPLSYPEPKSIIEAYKKRV